MQHAIFSPSSSHRWINCPASIKAGLFYPETTNEKATRGTVIHQLGEDNLNGIDTLLERDNIVIGKGCDPFPVSQVTEDMIDYAEEYAEYVNEIKGDNGTLWVELKTDLTDLDKNMFGHSDAVVYDPDAKELHVIDLKTGTGMVDADNNSQLKLYAYGAYKMVTGAGNQVDKITLHIFQRGNVHDWTLSPDALVQWINDIVKPAIADAKSVHPTFRPDTHTCQWCKARNDCKPYADAILDEFDVINDTDIVADARTKKEQKINAVKVINDKLSLTDKIKFVKTYEAVSKVIDEFKDEVIREIQTEHNGTFNGYKTVVNYGYPKWVDADAIPKLLKNKYGLDNNVIFKTEIKSPSAIKKALKEIDKDEVIDEIADYIHTVPSSILLVPENSKRELTTKSYSTLVDEHFQALKPVKDEFEDLTVSVGMEKIKDEVDEL